MISSMKRLLPLLFAPVAALAATVPFTHAGGSGIVVVRHALGSDETPIPIR